MNEEEKKAIEYSKNCLMKITLGIDCEFNVNTLDTLLNIIKRLQKENKELKDKYATFVKMSSEAIANSIPVQKVKDKIEELKKNLYTVEHYETVGAINVLRELLEGRK